MIKYNPKIDYLICKWLAEPRRNHKEFVLRAVFFNQEIPKTNDQLKICRYRDTFKLLISHKIDDALEVFFKNYKQSVLVNCKHIRKYYDKEPNYDLFRTLLIDSNIPTVLAVLLFDAIRVKSDLFPIIFQTRHLDSIIEFIKREEFYEAKRIYDFSLALTERFLIKKSIFSKDFIIEKIGFVRNELKLDYNISKVYIYGSIARDDANEYSDLDVVAVTDLITFDDDYVFSLQKYIEEQVKMPIDLHLFSEIVDYSIFDKKIIEDMLQII